MRKLLIVLAFGFVLGCNVLVCAENENAKKKTSQELADNLIKECGGINQPNKAGLTPLHQAVLLIDNKKVAEVLIEKGADLKKVDLAGNTPLNYLLEVYLKEDHRKGFFLREDKFNKLYDMVKLLVEKGADINTKNKNNGTPLLFACDFRWGETLRYTDKIARFLIEKGADVKAKDFYGRAPLHLSIPQESKKISEMLIARGADVNAKDNGENTPLFEASSIEVVKLLIDKGADVKAVNNYGNTPLHEFAWYEYNESTKLLIAKGADVNARNKDGRTPLDGAKYPKMVAYIRQHGGKTICELINTEAEIAAEADRLIKLSGGINGTDGEGVTPLCKAIKMDHKGVVECLVNKGADVNLKTKEGLMPLIVAILNCHEEQDVAIAELLISKKADVNGKNSSGETPLHVAARYGPAIMIRTLIQAGAKVDAEEELDGTPLHYAAGSNGNLEAVKVLIEKGANINAKNKKGETPLDKAIESSSRENCNPSCFDVVKLIREKGGKSGKDDAKEINKEKK